MLIGVFITFIDKWTCLGRCSTRLSVLVVCFCENEISSNSLVFSTHTNKKEILYRLYNNNFKSSIAIQFVETGYLLYGTTYTISCSMRMSVVPYNSDSIQFCNEIFAREMLSKYSYWCWLNKYCWNSQHKNIFRITKIYFISTVMELIAI